jgi:hypothetical protein
LQNGLCGLQRVEGFCVGQQADVRKHAKNRALIDIGCNQIRRDALTR